MKRQGSDFIFHGLSVNDMVHFTTSNALRTEFMDLERYTVDFNITGAVP
jgi:hypothetical protein